MTSQILREGMALKIQCLQGQGVTMVDEAGEIYQFLLRGDESIRQLDLQTKANATQIEQAAKVSTGKIVLPISIGDIIRLRAKTMQAAETLLRCGEWFKLVSAAATPAPRWFLNSVPREKQGLAKIHNFTTDNLWLFKENDPEFEVIQICPFPKAFDYREFR